MMTGFIALTTFSFGVAHLKTFLEFFCLLGICSQTIFVSIALIGCAYPLKIATVKLFFYPLYMNFYDVNLENISAECPNFSRNFMEVLSLFMKTIGY